VRWLPWVVACIGGLIGLALGAGQRGGHTIAGLCAAGGYLLGEALRFAIRRAAEKQAKHDGAEYSPQEWQEYKKRLKP